jgi:hypothetical protein
VADTQQAWMMVRFAERAIDDARSFLYA